jgi:hypothetical protein
MMAAQGLHADTLRPYMVAAEGNRDQRMQRLEIYQSLWAMELRRPDGVERSLGESFEMVAEAGYHGMALDLVAQPDGERTRQLKKLYQRHGLGCSITTFPKRIDDLRPVLHMAKEFDAGFVNIIGQVMPLSVEGMIPVIRQWITMAEEEGVPVLFETHRNAITNDLFSTLLLLDAVPELRLCADLSHFLIDREFWYPISPEDDALMQRVLARSDSFQGRVASREQIQVQISFPQHAKWFDLFARWWQDGIAMWRARSGDDAVLNFLCELGPPEYAITDAEGYEMSDRWEDALMIRRRVEDIWARLESGT